MSEKSLANGNGHRHEGTDANVRGVTMAGIVMAAVIALALLIVTWTIRGLMRWASPAEDVPFSGAAQTPPEPRLQRDPTADMTEMQARENAILETYGWVDQGKGVARIPIGRAIELIGSQGLPARGAAPVKTVPPTGAPSGGPQTGPPVEKTPRPSPPAPQGVEH